MVELAVIALKEGGVIAYPTEAVMGLGCDPFQEQAVRKIIKLKQRDPAQGMICVFSDWYQVSEWVLPVDEDKLAAVFATWPGPVTWIFPASEAAPPWVCRGDKTVALRWSAHPVVTKLCDAFGGAIVSTSANQSGESPCLNQTQVQALWGDDIDAIVSGALGEQTSVSQIRDVLTGKTYRS